MTTIPDGAALLGVVDGYEYLAVEWVYRRRDDGPLEYYATRAAWPETPAAQIAAHDQVIEDLRAKVAELEARLLDATPATAARVRTGGAANRSRCPHCRKKIWPSLLEKHIADQHGQAEPAPAEKPPIVLLDDRSDWRCELCGQDTHARGLRNSAICMKCEQVGPPRPKTNGVHV